MISRPSGLMIECDDFNIIYDIICIDSDYESNSNKSIYMTIWIHKMPNMMSASIDLRPSIGSLRSNAYSIGIWCLECISHSTYATERSNGRWMVW